MKKIDKETVEKEFNKKGYILLGEYQDCHTPIDLINEDGYKCSMDYSHLQEGSKPILFGKRCKFQKDNIKLLLFRRNPDLEFIDCATKQHSGKMRTLVTIKCTCGNEFVKEFSHIQNDKYILCEKCARELRRKSHKNTYNNKYLRNIERSKYQLINPNQDLYANKSVEVIDTETQFRGYINPNRLHRKMLIFSMEYNRDNYIYNTNVLLQKYRCKTRALELVNDKEIRFLCECGKEYTANAMTVSKTGKCYCDECTKRISKYELMFKEYLDNNNIKYRREYLFNNCRDIIPLPFDFHLDDYDVLIEIDGRQHKYDPYTIYHDGIKNEYCKEHNIPLLRIWYEDILNDNYISIFEEFIKPFRD